LNGHPVNPNPDPPTILSDMKNRQKKLRLRLALTFIGASSLLLAMFLLAGPVSTPTADAFSGQAETEVDLPNLVSYSGDSRQWIVTITGMVIASIAAPVIVGQFKSRAERSEQDLGYAWVAARRAQEQLIEAKDSTIGRLAEELRQARKSIEVLDQRNDQLHERMLKAELQLVETIKRLATVAPSVNISQLD